MQKKMLDRLEKEKKQYKRNLDYLVHEINPQHEKFFIEQQKAVIHDNISTIKNPRGAGRKPKLNQGQVEEVKVLRKGGSTIAQLAKSFDCSTGLIHKLINENQG